MRVWLNEMNWGGKADYSRMDFVDVVTLERLVWNHSSTDKDWKQFANPMMPDWPRVLLTIVTFTDVGNKTNVRLTQTPVNPAENEVACFAKFMANMDKGWGGGYAIQDDILKELQKGISNMTVSEPKSQRRSVGLWIVGGLGLIWNALGAMNLFMQLNANMLASMPADQRAIVESRPSWATLAFAIGVLAGVVGCVLLLMRQRSAFPVLAISLAAIALHMISYFGMAGNGVVFGPMHWVLYAILPLAVAGFLAWYAQRQPST